MPARIEVFPEVGLRHGGIERAGSGQGFDNRRVERIITLRKHRHRELVVHKRPADSALKILPAVRQFDGGVELRRVQHVISQIEIEVASHPAGSGFCDDLDAAESGAAVFGRKWIRVDADFLDLILGRNPAAEKSVDNELHAAGGRGCRPGKLG